MKQDRQPEGIHPGDFTATNTLKEPHVPRRARYDDPQGRADRRLTKLAIIALLFALAAVFAGLSMWLATLGPLTGGDMVVPGIIFTK